jgi:hypothetical protein
VELEHAGDRAVTGRRPSRCDKGALASAAGHVAFGHQVVQRADRRRVTDAELLADLPLGHERHVGRELAGFDRGHQFPLDPLVERFDCHAWIVNKFINKNKI